MMIHSYSISNALFCGDNAEFIKKYLCDNILDITITSPPYDDLRKYTGYSFNLVSLAKELYRTTKDGGIVVWVVGDRTIKGSESGSSFKQALVFKEVGFNIHDTMIYAKKNPIPLTHRRYEQAFEYMFVFSKGRPKSFNGLEEPCKTMSKPGNFRHDSRGILEPAHKKEGNKKTKLRSNIWFYDVGKNKTSKDAFASKHPACFPEDLVRDHLISWSNPEDIVFDPFCGSGTTCKVAFAMNRRFLGVDISEEYIYNVCCPRLEEIGWSKRVFSV